MAHERPHEDLFGDSDDEAVEDPIENLERTCMKAPCLTPDLRSQLLTVRDSRRGLMNFREGSEEALLLFVERMLSNRETQGESTLATPDMVLRCVDVFCYSRQWMMHAGDKKRPILAKAIETARLAVQATGSVPPRPLSVCELGSYCGYSAVLIGSLLKDGERLVSIESDLRAVRYATRLLALAGLEVRARVEVVHGNAESIYGSKRTQIADGPPTVNTPAGVEEEATRGGAAQGPPSSTLMTEGPPTVPVQVLPHVPGAKVGGSSGDSGDGAVSAPERESGNRDSPPPHAPMAPDKSTESRRCFGLLFLDHAKECYLSDLKLLLGLGLLAPGALVVADNINFGGDPHEEYLNFVRASRVERGGLLQSSPANEEKRIPTPECPQPPTPSPLTPTTTTTTAAAAAAAAAGPSLAGARSPFKSSTFIAAHVEYTVASDDPADLTVPLTFRDGVEVSCLGF